KYGLLVDVQPEWFAAQGGLLATAVLVETPEHGRELNRWLPDWKLLKAAANLVIPEFHQLPLPAYGRSILTVGYLWEYGLDAQVLIKARGTERFTSTKWKFRRSGGKGDRLLVIEPSDAWTAQAQEIRL